jgi:hypothetical protein
MEFFSDNSRVYLGLSIQPDLVLFQTATRASHINIRSKAKSVYRINAHMLEIQLAALIECIFIEYSVNPGLCLNTLVLTSIHMC